MDHLVKYPTADIGLQLWVWHVFDGGSYGRFYRNISLQASSVFSDQRSHNAVTPLVEETDSRAHLCDSPPVSPASNPR